MEVNMNKIDETVEKYIIEGSWKKLPSGWTEASVKKFAKSLTNIDGTEHGFIDACIKKMTGNIDDPGAFCATIVDTLKHTTDWRFKGKTKDGNK